MATTVEHSFNLIASGYLGGLTKSTKKLSLLPLGPRDKVLVRTDSFFKFLF